MSAKGPIVTIGPIEDPALRGLLAHSGDHATEMSDYVHYVVEQMTSAGDVSSRAMFGGHAIYCDGKVAALVCDDQLFVKPTEPGRAFIGDVEEAPPYAGAKPYFRIGARVEDGDWLGELVRLTAEALPAPRPRKKKAGSGKKTG